MHIFCPLCVYAEDTHQKLMRTLSAHMPALSLRIRLKGALSICMIFYLF
jgi:hypothetical protein